jgi:hypothetical protein
MIEECSLAFELFYHLIPLLDEGVHFFILFHSLVNCHHKMIVALVCDELQQLEQLCPIFLN